MHLPRLIVITDWSLGREALLSALARACELGPEVAVQHRHPEATGRAFLEEAHAVAALCRRHGSPLFVSQRLDVALLVGAHLHLPSSGVPPSAARPHLGKRLISASVHDEAEAAQAEGADLALVSPVFRPGSKPNDTRPPLGREGFSRIARHLACPAFALGGIGPESAGALKGHAAGLAAVSSVLCAPDPKLAAAAILGAF